MVIQICCIIIFIVYFAICSLLTYYFIKKRPIWDSIFSIKSIWNSLKELIICPEHFLIWLPFIEFENTSCTEKKKIRDDARIQIKKVLEHILNIMKNIIEIKANSNNSNNNNNNNLCNIEKTKWIIEGTMKDFEHMYDENTDFYNKLASSYDILNDKFSSDKNIGSLISLEDLVILENNIELCENISNILSIFSNEDYKLLKQIESGYMSSLIYDLIENIKIYKIKGLLYMM
jgi:hypothetical protein